MYVYLRNNCETKRKNVNTKTADMIGRDGYDIMLSTDASDTF